MPDYPPRLKRLLAHPLPWVFVICAASFIINIRHNDRPYWYTWDEESKGTQVMNQSRNFNHPLLCVNTAALFQQVLGSEKASVQEVVVNGRITSAFFLAIAAGSFAWLAWMLAGPWAAFFCGVFVTFHPEVLYAARYFKEDASFIASWALLTVALFAYQSKPSRRRSVAAGLAAALCVSAKYIGVVPVLAGSLFMALTGPRDHRHTRLIHAGIFWGVLAAGVLAVNYQAVINLDVVAARIGNEITHQLYNDTGGAGLLALIARESGVGGLAGMLLYLAFRLSAVRRWPKIELFALASGGIYFVLLLFIQRLVSRYILPLWLIEWWLTAIGLGLFIRLALSRSGRSRVLCTAAAVVLAAFTGYGLLESGIARFRAYAGPDNRLVMARYIDERLPSDAYVAYDHYVMLADPYRGRVMPDGFAPRRRMYGMVTWPDEFGPDMLGVLKGLGMTHVVTMPVFVDKYFRDDINTSFGLFRDAVYRRPFYDRLRRDGEVVLELPAGPDEALSPMLRLYRMP